ncbi:hypothetical protein [Phaeobacter italicus]|uniref:hypothetical protein n=1 Tax=Phaeobacter italicus TaxID=481446 RepID=UPI001CD66984|nr:hypothetical protein [Phaeobacter italicus]MCA0856172.1 hypothetical protein [Phaeobacter italicus]
MSVEKHKVTAEAEIGTIKDFKDIRMIESVATLELSDGRKGSLVRCAFGHPFFEIKIDGESKYMRINLTPALTAAAELLAELTAPAETEQS